MEQAITAVQVSARFPFNHGAPIHMGDPAAIGADLANPLFGTHAPAHGFITDLEADKFCLP